MYLLNAPDLVICLFNSELIWLDSPSFLYNMTGLQQVLARLVAGHPSGLLGSAWLASLCPRTAALLWSAPAHWPRYGLRLRTVALLWSASAHCGLVLVCACALAPLWSAPAHWLRYGLRLCTVAPLWSVPAHCGPTIVCACALWPRFGLCLRTVALLWSASAHCGPAMVWACALWLGFGLRLRTVACYGLRLHTGPDSYLRLLGVGKFVGRWQDHWTIVCFKVGRSA